MSRFTNKVVNKFAEKYYTGLITVNHIPDNKEEVTHKEYTGVLDEKGKEIVVSHKIWGWKLPYKQQKMFIPDKIGDNNTLDLLPIKVTDTEEFSYKNEVLLRVLNAQTFRIRPELQMPMEEMYQELSKIKHSSPMDFKVYCALMLTQIPLKFNWRLATTGGFGKTNTYKQICTLLPNNLIMKVKSESKLMKESHQRTSLVIEEFTDLHKQTKIDIEDFFKIHADGSDKITNPAHKSAVFKTLDEYDIGQLSYGFFYNTVKDAQDKGRGDEYFDNIYDFPTRQRFFPMLLEGEINGMQFKVDITQTQRLYDDNESFYLRFVKSMLYYIENPTELVKGKEHWKWKNDKTEFLQADRLKTTLWEFLNGLKACSKDENEFNLLADQVWIRYKMYEAQLIKDAGHPINKKVKSKINEY